MAPLKAELKLKKKIKALGCFRFFETRQFIKVKKKMKENNSIMWRHFKVLF